MADLTQELPNPDTWYQDWPEALYHDRPALCDLLRLAKINRLLRDKLAADPLGTCVVYGVGRSPHAIQNWLGLDARHHPLTDEELLDFLILLLDSREPANRSCSGG